MTPDVFKRAFLCGVAFVLGQHFARHEEPVSVQKAFRLVSANDDSLWNPDLHPRNKDGKFEKKNGQNSFISEPQNKKQKVEAQFSRFKDRKIKGRIVTAEEQKQIADRVARGEVSIGDVRKDLKISAFGKTKDEAELIKSIYEQAQEIIRLEALTKKQKKAIIEQNKEAVKKAQEVARQAQQREKEKLNLLKKDLNSESLKSRNGVNFYDALTSCAANDYVDMRTAQKTRGNLAKGLESALKRADALDEMISLAPKFKGKLYRGISVSDEDLNKLLSGKPFCNGAITSWSEKQPVAEMFATSNRFGKATNKIVFIGQNFKNAASISKYIDSNGEHEVLTSSNTELKVVDSYKKGDITYLKVEQT